MGKTHTSSVRSEESNVSVKKKKNRDFFFNADTARTHINRLAEQLQ